MTDSSPRYNVPFVQPGQANAHLILNEATAKLEQLANGSVISRTVANQPTTPVDGDAYLLLGGAVGVDWGSQGGNLAYYLGGWFFVQPYEGMTVWIKAEQQYLVYTNGNWLSAGGISGGSSAPDAVQTFRRWIPNITPSTTYRIPLFYSPGRILLSEVTSLMTSSTPGAGNSIQWRLHFGTTYNGTLTPVLLGGLQLTDDGTTQGIQHTIQNNPLSTTPQWFILTIEAVNGTGEDFFLNVRYRKA